MKRLIKSGAAGRGRPAIGVIFTGLAAVAVIAGQTTTARPSQVAEVPTELELSSAQVEQIVRDYLRREPQLIYDAMVELRHREQDAYEQLKASAEEAHAG